MPLPESTTSAENGHSGPYRRRCPAAWACQHKKGTQKTSQEHATVVDEDERGHTSEEVSSSSSFSSSSSPAWRKKKPSPADEAQILHVSAVPTANRASISWTSACRLCCLLRSSSFLTWAASAPPLPSAPQAHGTSGRRARPHRRLHLPTPPERAGRESACRPTRSAAGCGHSSAARAPRGCPGAPPEVVCSVPVGRRAKRSPPPPTRPWLSSVPVGGVLLHLLLLLQVGDVRGVVESLSQGHRDRLTLMPQHGAQSSLPPPHGGSSTYAMVIHGTR